MTSPLAFVRKSWRGGLGSSLPAMASMAVLLACGGDGEAELEPENSSNPPAEEGSWTLALSPQVSGTESLLQAVSPVNAQVAWISGHNGTYARTTDGGRHWRASVMEGEDHLQFRDVEAFDSLSALLMSAGAGDLSRIYRTADGGQSWRLQYRARDPEAFLDCMAFWDPDRGLAYGDAVDGVPFILRTLDGGEHWNRVPRQGLPQALEGEGGFAASGTCLITGREGEAWIATGAGPRPRILLTLDWGETWRGVEVPAVGGAMSGLTTLAMTSQGVGLAMGGTIGEDSLRTQNVVRTEDGGLSWREGPLPAMPGPVYGSAILDLGTSLAAVAVGPRGMDWAPGPDFVWRTADSRAYWAVGFSEEGLGWAVGPEGRVVALTLQANQ